MQKTLVALFTLTTLVGVAGAQQVSSSSRASASSKTSVSSSPSGANSQSDASANASSQATVAAPEHHSGSKEAQEPKRNGHSHDQKAGSPEAAGGLSAGTTVNAVLAKSLDSSKCKPGDPVVATAAQDVKADGKVVIRRGSHLIGHVTEAKPKGKGEASSSLGIVFDHAVLKNGQQLPMNSVVQALAAAQTSSAASVGDDGFGAVGGGNSAGRGSAGGGGLLGGVTSATGAATGAVANAGGSATGAVNSTLGSTASVGGGLQDSLSSTTSGVIGLKGLSLASDAANSTQGSVITSPGKSVHLDSGTQMVLRVVNQ